jgi:hypothetical protein
LPGPHPADPNPSERHGDTKQDRSERLVLRAFGHPAVDGQVGQKRFHFRLTHLLGMNLSACSIMVKSQNTTTQRL